MKWDDMSLIKKVELLHLQNRFERDYTLVYTFLFFSFSLLLVGTSLILPYIYTKEEIYEFAGNLFTLAGATTWATAILFATNIVLLIIYIIKRKRLLK